MDLYRTLRVSLYLLAGSGAFAISVAERGFFHLALIVILGTISYNFIDKGRIKPLTAEMTAALTLVLLFVTARPLRNDEQWQAHFPGAVAHFLCAWQGLLFFSVYSGPILLTFCGSTLAVVVMSGVVHSGPSLVVRMACFIAVAVWTLYIHALWRARQEFAGHASMLLAGSEKSRGESKGRDDTRQLPEQAFWGTLRLVAGMAAACLALGTFIFFSAPRIEGLTAFFDKRNNSALRPELSPIQQGREGGPLMTSGLSTTVRLNKLARIEPDVRAALKAKFSKPVRDIAGPGKWLLLKSASLSEYSAGQWVPDGEWEEQEARAGEPLVAPHDPSLDGPVYAGEEVLVTVDSGALKSGVIVSAGPILRVGLKKIKVNHEGTVTAAGENISTDKYTLKFSMPATSEKLPLRARAEHRDLRRYVLRRDIADPNEREAVENLARQICSRSPSDLARAFAIIAWLRENCSYTLELDRLHPQGDPVAHFLLSTDREQRRGHCGLFASAFVVLCRMNNLPTRLCMGFAVPLTNSPPASTEAVARNSDAHAWAEIYFKNVGWVAFDPTPPARPMPGDETISVAARKAPSAGGSDSGREGVATAKENREAGVVQSAWEWTMKFDRLKQRELFERIAGGQSESSASALLTGRGWGGWFGAGLIWSGLAATVFWMAQLFVKRGRKRKFSNLNAGGRARAAVAFYNDLLVALSRRGYTRKPGQTPREFADTVIGRGGQAFAPAREITEIFEAVRYGRNELAQDEFNRLQEALDRIREMTF